MPRLGLELVDAESGESEEVHRDQRGGGIGRGEQSVGESVHQAGSLAVVSGQLVKSASGLCIFGAVAPVTVIRHRNPGYRTCHRNLGVKHLSGY